MFDALKRRKETTKSVEEQLAELQALIATAREERGALSTMLTQIEVRAGKVSLPQVSKAVQRVADKATAASDQLDAVAGRLTAVEEQGKEIGKLDGRVKALANSVTQADASAEKLLSPNGELQKHRTAVQKLSTQDPANWGKPGGAQEGPGGARSAAQQPAGLPGGAQGCHRTHRGAEGGARSAARGLNGAGQGIYEAQGIGPPGERRICVDCRDGQGHRHQVRPFQGPARVEQDDRGADRRAQLPRGARLAESQGTGEPEAHRGACRRGVEPAERDGVEHGRADLEASGWRATGRSDGGAGRADRAGLARDAGAAGDGHQVEGRAVDGRREARSRP